ALAVGVCSGAGAVGSGWGPEGAHLLLAQPYDFLPGARGGRSFLPGRARGAQEAAPGARAGRPGPRCDGGRVAGRAALGLGAGSPRGAGDGSVHRLPRRQLPCPWGPGGCRLRVQTPALCPPQQLHGADPSQLSCQEPDQTAAVGPAEQFLSIPRSPQMPQSRQVSSCRTETDNESLPSYENQEGPRAGDDDDDYNNELYATGYVEVLPDSMTEPAAELVTSRTELRDSASSVAPADDYENVPEAQRQSLADSLEYINMPESGSSLPDDHCGSSNRESEDDCPDYENLHR
ncbi:linker for activation of T-cells family member 1, partial [Pelodiscus sinensis]|uniref:linker for activation of T-cells family member 1 n=1 Tax=Pelodiscus sinensis TaxID=13735 RepID=UPI003F6AE56D